MQMLTFKLSLMLMHVPRYMYMAKYATKGEPRSQAVPSIFKSSVDHVSDNSDAHKVLRSAMVRSVGERDFSAQETAHQLLSLPL